MATNFDGFSQSFLLFSELTNYNPNNYPSFSKVLCISDGTPSFQISGFLVQFSNILELFVFSVFFFQTSMGLTDFYYFSIFFPRCPSFVSSILFLSSFHFLNISPNFHRISPNFHRIYNRILSRILNRFPSKIPIDAN